LNNIKILETLKLSLKLCLGCMDKLRAYELQNIQVLQKGYLER